MPTPTPPDTTTVGRTGPTEPGRTVRRLTTGWGWFMLSMAGVNAWLAATGESQLYVEFAETAHLELYRDAWEALVEPHPLPWVVALVAFEAAAGAATLGDGRRRLAGLWASALFVLALTPANAYTLGNPLLAALPAYLAVRHQRPG